MESASSIRSAPPPYTSTLPDLDLSQPGQQSQTQTAQQQQQVIQQPQPIAPQQPSQHHYIAFHQAQHPHQLVPQYHIQQYPPWSQGYLPQPQPQPQSFYYQPPPLKFAVSVPIYPIPAPVFYHLSPPYPGPYFHQHPFRQPIPTQPPLQTYPPFLHPFQFSATQHSSAPTQQTHLMEGNMEIVQAGFLPHPPAIIPGVPGVHQYPLIVRKEGEGPPPEPVFVDGYAGSATGQQS